MVENAEEALKEASLKTEAEIVDYTVAPVFMSDKKQGSHEWMIEFKKSPKDISFGDFLCSLFK